MWFFLACLSLLGYCFVLTKRTNLAIETMPFLVISSVVTILYCFAYMQLLRIGVTLVFGFGLLSIIYTPIIFFNEQDLIFKKYLTPGFTLGLFICGLALLTADPFVVGFDSIVYWGVRAKLMFINHGFVKADTVISHKSYPPGSALFYYFFTWFKFDELKLVMAQQLLLLAPFLVLFQGITWKNWRTIITYCIFGVIFAAILLKEMHAPIWSMRTLYMDFPVAIFFGISIIYYRMSDRKVADILRLLPPIFALSLFKPRFFHLVFIMTMIVSTDQFLEGLFYIKEHAKSKILTKRSVIGLVFKNKKPLLKRISSVLLISLVGCVAIYSWEFYTVSIHTHIDFSMSNHLTLKTFMNVLTLQHLTPLQLVTIKRFSVKMIKPLFVSLIFISTVFAICQWQRTTRERYLIAAENIILLLGSIVYLFGLLLLYLFAFSRYEGPRLVSFYRYVNIYYFAWWLVLYNTVFYTFIGKVKKTFQNSKAYSWLVIVVIIFSTIFIIYHYHTSRYKSSMQWHRELQNVANAAKIHVPVNARTKVFLVWQNTTGLFFANLRMNLTPAIIEWERTISNGLISKDQWHKNWTVNEFLQAVSKNGYLLIGYADKRFWQDYGSVFPAHLSKLKPLILYNMCMGKGWNSMNKKPCTMARQRAYLFKVIVKDKDVTLKNMVN